MYGFRVNRTVPSMGLSVEKLTSLEVFSEVYENSGDKSLKSE